MLPVCLLILAAGAAFVPLPAFVERPREPLDLAAAVKVDAPEGGPVDGTFLLTAVRLRRAVPADLVLALFDDQARLVPVEDVLPSGQRDRAFFNAQRRVFADSVQLAAAIGLDAAGYDALGGAGAEVLGVEAGSPAEGVLEPGDVIVAVDDRPVSTSLDLVDAVRDPDARGARRLTVRRRDGERLLVVTPRPLTRDEPQLGVQAQTVDLRIDLPFDVAVDGGRIGGPSAGLVLALTVYDLADPRDLAAGRRIAGTGQILPNGSVREIGGLRAKVAGAAGAGADVFLVPAAQEAEAAAALPEGSDLQVIGVTSFRDAVDALAGEGQGGV